MNKLTSAQIAKMIDHSLLQPQMTRKDIEEGCDLALEYDCASVCVRGYDVEYCAERVKDSEVMVAAVVGFPHGNSTTESKIFETEDYIKKGADEIDVVVAIGHVRSGMYDYVKAELKAVNDICVKNDVALKVIFENAYLTKEEIAECSKICDELDVAFVKTSTGYAPSGAVAEDLKIMRENTKDSIEIKAAGGVRTLDQMLEYYEIGVTRFGTRSTEAIVKEAIERGL